MIVVFFIHKKPISVVLMLFLLLIIELLFLCKSTTGFQIVNNHKRHPQNQKRNKNNNYNNNYNANVVCSVFYGYCTSDGGGGGKNRWLLLSSFLSSKRTTTQLTLSTTTTTTTATTGTSTTSTVTTTMPTESCCIDPPPFPITIQNNNDGTSKCKKDEGKQQRQQKPHTNGNNNEIDATNNEQEVVSRRMKSKQLWLDLRDTAVTPLEAIRYLSTLLFQQKQQQIQTTSCDTNEKNHNDAEDFPILEYIDGIIIPKNNNNTNVNYNNSREYELYYVSETSDADDCTIDNRDKYTTEKDRFLYRYRSSESFVSDHENDDTSSIVGTILRKQSTKNSSTDNQQKHTSIMSLLWDPIHALDIISSQQAITVADVKQLQQLEQKGYHRYDDDDHRLRWIVIDHNHNDNQYQYTFSSLSNKQQRIQIIETIRTLLDFLLSVLQTTTTTTNSTANTTINLAITCPTREVFIDMDWMLTEYQYSRMGDNDKMDIESTTTGSSGLILPSSSSSSCSSKPFICTALIVPFDLEIWKVAFDLVTSTNNE